MDPMRPSDRDPARHQRREHRGRVFDAAPTTDDGVLNYPVSAVLPTTVEPVRKVWRRGAVLDQGPDGACVGHAWAGEGAADPIRVNWPNVSWPDRGTPAPKTVHEAAFWLYYEFQRRDEWAGEDYSGTSVNAGGLVMRDLALIGSFRWARTRAEMRDALITQGPLVIAIPWLDGMFDPDAGELLITGQEVGWHAVLVNGYDPAFSVAGRPKREMGRMLNSWGTGWGTYGSVWFDFGRMWDHIEANYADVCLPIGRAGA